MVNPVVTTDDEVQKLLKRVRQVELRTKKAVTASGQGAYHSRFKGRGMAFSESRAYANGDDPRYVDWNATARRFSETGGEGGGLFVKQFVEERELTLILAVDISASMTTGTHVRKRQLAAEAAALLAFSALRNNDKVGLLLFSDRTERLVRPRKGRAHVLRIVREILAHKPVGKGTDLVQAVEVATHLSKQRAIVAMISDFTDENQLFPAKGANLSKLERPLKVLARRHDLMMLEVFDPLDHALPNVGVLSVKDAETNATTLIDTSSAAVRAAYHERMMNERKRVRAAIDKLGVDRQLISEDELSNTLVRFLRRRRRSAA